MSVANRFGNSESIPTLGYTQLVQMLALPEGEEEKFIEEKSVAGTPVENMTVKKLRAEIKDWKTQAEKQKARAEDAESRVRAKQEQYNDMIQTYNRNFFAMQEEKDAEAEKLKKENEELKKDNALKLDVNRSNAEEYFKLRDKYQKLQQEKTVEVFPPDYEENKKQIADLQAKLAQPNVEFVPDDYEQIKQQLADLQAKQDFFKVDIATSQALNQFFMMANFLHEHQDRLADVLNGYLDSDPLTPQRVNQISFIANFLKKVLGESCK